MRRMLLSTAAALFAASAAHAADPVIFDQPLMSPQPIAQFSWTGFYVGANAGYGGGTFEHPFTFGPEDLDDFEPIIGSLDVSAGGGLAGVQAGYNWQFNQWVFGAETDIQWSGIKGEVSGFIDPGDSGFPLDGAAAAGTEVEWFGTIRARLGYSPVERMIVYATGGAAYGKINSYVEFGDDALSTDDTEWGWTAGAGVEYAFTDALSFKTEYLYTDLGSRTLIPGEFIGASGGLSSDVKFHTVRAGVNFHF